MGREMGGRFKREGIYVYLWLIHVRFDRKQQNSVKQLSFNKNKLINLKKSMPPDLKSSWKAFLLFFFFCFLLVVETFSLQKVSRCLKKWQSVGKRPGEYGGGGKSS